MPENNPNQSKIDEIVSEILKSKNYSKLDIELIRGVVLNLFPKYSSKIVVKEVKNKLHQIWGAFYDANPNFNKILSRSELNLTDLEQIMQLHSSTAERYQLLPGFWTEILSKTSGVKKIVEYGCGLNGLSLLDFKLKSEFEFEYLGYDIDLDQTSFLNELFAKFQAQNEFKSQTASIFYQDVSQDKDADLVLLLKLLPTLEQQRKGTGLDLLNKISNKFVVVSFPVFSLGRKSKNMTEFYCKWFEELVTKLDFKTKSTKLEFKTELVFVIERLSW